MTKDDKDENDVCPKCGGSGSVPISDDDPEYQRLKEKYGDFADAYRTDRICDCALEDRFRDKMGDLIYNAKRLDKNSPLDDLLTENVFISSTQSAFLPHMRHALKEGNWQSLFVRQTTDSELRDVFVGNLEEYKSINDFSSRPDLLVIYLGILSYKNKAMDGIVLEALRARVHQEKATWIVNPPDYPFKEGHLAWSPELELYIEERFKNMEIRSKKSSSGRRQDTGAQQANDIAKNMF